MPLQPTFTTKPAFDNIWGWLLDEYITLQCRMPNLESARIQRTGSLGLDPEEHKLYDRYNIA
jgi:hypothetical protein